MKKNTFTTIASAIICGLSTLSATAQQRNMSEAAAIARQALTEAHVDNARQLKPVSGNLLEIAMGRQQTPQTQRRMPSFAIADKQPFYVFNDDNADAFVIVAGDKRMGDVLGYSTTAHFVTDGMPDGLAHLLTFYSQVYSEVSTTTPTLKAPRKADTWIAVPQLMETRWGQGKPYNDECPIQNGDHCLTGCGATAMAQIMRYHQWPAVGQGTNTYTTTTTGTELTVDFSNIKFNWANMGTYYYNNQTAPDVATLMKACGVSVNMDYTTYNSMSYIVDFPFAFINFFNYSSDVVCYLRKYFKDETWSNIIQRELLERRPILFRGANAQDNNGHLFVVDGCDQDGKLHINWGWYGNSDGYFQINGFKVGNDDYSYEQFAVLKISPTDLGEKEDVFFATQFGAQHQNTVVTANLTNVWCYASNTRLNDGEHTFVGSLGLGLYDTSGHFLANIASFNVSLKCTWGYYDANFRCNDSNLLSYPDGTYVLRPIATNKATNLVTPIRTMQEATDSVFLVIDNGNIEILESITDAIHTPAIASAKKATNVYTIGGRKLSRQTTAEGRLTKGVYIVDGKKVVKR